MPVRHGWPGVRLALLAAHRPDAQPVLPGLRTATSGGELMTVRVWRCRRVKAGVPCGTLNLRVKRLCTTCAAPRPKPRAPKHRAVLGEMPYEQWVERFGEVCGICGKAPSARRRLDRDHCHKSGSPRGLLDFRCNRALAHWMTPAWLRAAADYLERADAARTKPR